MVGLTYEVSIIDQLRDLADSRLITGCIYCGAAADSRDHVPARVLLDRPFPENLPVVPACRPCNLSFSEDEEYVACLLASILSGTTDPKKIRRPVVAEILGRSSKLRARLEAALYDESGNGKSSVEADRVLNILKKLARGHAAYELSKVCRDEPSHVRWGLLSQLSKAQRDELEDVHVTQMFAEVGSRGMQRLLVAEVTLAAADGTRSSMGLLINDWIGVQEGRYRYLAYEEHLLVRVKIVIDEYLYCDLAWLQGAEGG